MYASTPRQNDDPDLARWGLVALALVVGAFLMVYYVHLLQDSVTRGAQWRYSQVNGAPAAVAEVTPASRIQLVGAKR